jgi:hypothetical protein
MKRAGIRFDSIFSSTFPVCGYFFLFDENDQAEVAWDVMMKFIVYNIYLLWISSNHRGAG